MILKGYLLPSGRETGEYLVRPRTRRYRDKHEKDRIIGELSGPAAVFYEDAAMIPKSDLERVEEVDGGRLGKLYLVRNQESSEL